MIRFVALTTLLLFPLHAFAAGTWTLLFYMVPEGVQFLVDYVLDGLVEDYLVTLRNKIENTPTEVGSP